jgi:hypothetical protein
MMNDTTSQLLEVFEFLRDPQPPVRRIALASLLYALSLFDSHQRTWEIADHKVLCSPYTTSASTERSLFLRDNHIEQLAVMCADIEVSRPFEPQ